MPSTTRDSAQFKGRLRLHRPYLSTSRFWRRRDPINYQRLYNAHVNHSCRPDSFHGLALQDSTVDGVSWSSTEKDHFFTALGRRGKSKVAEIARDVGKSVLEVSHYLHTLDTALQDVGSGRVAYRDLPAAYEVSPSSLSRECTLARGLARRATEKFHAGEARLGWSCLDASHLAEVREMMDTMTPAQNDLFHRSMPDLAILEYRAPRAPLGAGIYRSTSEDLYQLLKDRVTRWMVASIEVAESRMRVERGVYFEEKRFKGRAGVIDRDVLAAIEILDPAMQCQTKEENCVSIDHESTQDEDGEIHMSERQSENGLIGEEEEEEDELDELLDRYDANLAVDEENEYRGFLGLSALPDLPPLTSKELATLTRHMHKEQALGYDMEDD